MEALPWSFLNTYCSKREWLVSEEKQPVFLCLMRIRLYLKEGGEISRLHSTSGWTWRSQHCLVSLFDICTELTAESLERELLLPYSDTLSSFACFSIYTKVSRFLIFGCLKMFINLWCGQIRIVYPIYGSFLSDVSSSSCPNQEQSAF